MEKNKYSKLKCEMRELFTICHSIPLKNRHWKDKLNIFGFNYYQFIDKWLLWHTKFGLNIKSYDSKNDCDYQSVAWIWTAVHHCFVMSQTMFEYAMNFVSFVVRNSNFESRSPKSISSVNRNEHRIVDFSRHGLATG